MSVFHMIEIWCKVLPLHAQKGTIVTKKKIAYSKSISLNCQAIRLAAGRWFPQPIKLTAMILLKHHNPPLNPQYMGFIRIIRHNHKMLCKSLPCKFLLVPKP